jgi:hypothetical protein
MLVPQLRQVIELDYPARDTSMIVTKIIDR